MKIELYTNYIVLGDFNEYEELIKISNFNFMIIICKVITCTYV